VCISTLRYLRCRLPVELWHIGDSDIDRDMAALLAPLDVRCVDAKEVAKRFPARWLPGRELRPYAIIHSAFREVLFLDADNLPVRDPGYPSEASQYRAIGAIFGPNFGSFKKTIVGAPP
jgi:hypothetical protein